MQDSYTLLTTKRLVVHNGNEQRINRWFVMRIRHGLPRYLLYARVRFELRPTNSKCPSSDNYPRLRVFEPADSQHHICTT